VPQAQVHTHRFCGRAVSGPPQIVFQEDARFPGNARAPVIDCCLGTVSCRPRAVSGRERTRTAGLGQNDLRVARPVGRTAQRVPLPLQIVQGIANGDATGGAKPGQGDLGRGLAFWKVMSQRHQDRTSQVALADDPLEVTTIAADHPGGRAQGIELRWLVGYPESSPRRLGTCMIRSDPREDPVATLNVEERSGRGQALTHFSRDVQLPRRAMLDRQRNIPAQPGHREIKNARADGGESGRVEHEAFEVGGRSSRPTAQENANACPTRNRLVEVRPDHRSAPGDRRLPVARRTSHGPGTRPRAGTSNKKKRSPFLGRTLQ
jgi:hypothetical protein